MPLSDFMGFSEPLTKLIEVISSAIGRTFKAQFDRADVRTDVYRERKIAQERIRLLPEFIEALKENSNVPTNLLIELKDDVFEVKNIPKDKSEVRPEEETQLTQRTAARLRYQEEKRQLNIERIISHAANEILFEAEIDKEKVDMDWVNKFFRVAEDISNEEMQVLWGKILAGETAKPGRFSLRTLDILKNMTKSEADHLVHLSEYVIWHEDSAFIYSGIELFHAYTAEVPRSEVAQLMDMGIIHNADLLSLTLDEPKTDKVDVFTSGNIEIVLDRKMIQTKVSIPEYSFTASGKELLKLIVSIPQIDYLNRFAEKIQKPGFVIKYLIKDSSELKDFPIQ